MNKTNDALTVLTIEDNPSDLFLIEHMLKTSSLKLAKLYSTDRVGEAYKILQTEPIDLVLLDLTLPDSFGINTFIHLKPVVQRIPVIILTGMADTSLGVEAIKEGAQDYLIKGEFNENLLTKSIQYSLERKRNLEELREINVRIMASEEKYRQIFYKNPYPTWIYDLDSLQILEVNDAAMAKYGFDKNEFLGLTMKDLHPVAEAEEFLATLAHAEATPTVERKLWHHINKSGEIMIVEITTHLIDYFGRLSMQVIINDVTERVRLEKELAQQQKLKQQQITAVVLGAQERERSELGQELHDNINQILATSKLYLDVAIEENEPRIELLSKSRKNISMAIEEIRKLSRELITPSLNDLGLVQSIRELIRSIQTMKKMKIRLNISGMEESSLSPEQRVTVYRIIQEQLNNILKHAQASNVIIELNKLKEQIYLQIRDDGKGFDTRQRRKGVGISNIISRVELYNGRVDIESAPGKGCCLEVILNSKTVPE